MKQRVTGITMKHEDEFFFGILSDKKHLKTCILYADAEFCFDIKVRGIEKELSTCVVLNLLNYKKGTVLCNIAFFF